MKTDRLKEAQPIVYRTLSQALKNNKLAHAYLFYGPKGTGKKDAAMLLAQSVACPDTTDFACETCDTCKRIEHGNYANLLYLDGSTTSIKKSDILKLQQEFNKTGIENSNKKIYIINYAENATPDALNSLLKFLEEPESDMMAIFIVEQMDRMLDTIVSRCQCISFIPLSMKTVYNICIENGMDKTDAYLLSYMIRNYEQIVETSETDEYQHALYILKNILPTLYKDIHKTLVFLQNTGFNSKKKRNDKAVLNYLLDMLILNVKEVLLPTDTITEDWWLSSCNDIRNKNISCVKLIELLTDTKDKLLYSVNIPLLLDQFMFEMKEVLK